jgi:hypothetical protein
VAVEDLLDARFARPRPRVAHLAGERSTHRSTTKLAGAGAARRGAEPSARSAHLVLHAQLVAVTLRCRVAGSAEDWGGQRTCHPPPLISKIHSPRVQIHGPWRAWTSPACHGLGAGRAVRVAVRRKARHAWPWAGKSLSARIQKNVLNNI